MVCGPIQCRLFEGHDIPATIDERIIKGIVVVTGNVLCLGSGVERWCGGIEITAVVPKLGDDSHDKTDILPLF